MDLSDPEDVKVLAADANGEVLVHLGSGNYLQRYRTYVTHVQQWRQQFDKLESVDLRYDGQIIVNPDLQRDGPAAGVDAGGGESGDGSRSENCGHRELRKVCNASRASAPSKPLASEEGR